VCTRHSRSVARIGAFANTGDRRRFLQLAGVVAGALGAAALALGAANALAAAPTGGSSPSGPGSNAVLAPVPYMGWNTYYGVGGIFDEPTIRSVAGSLLDRGLARAGYRIVWLDFGWASGKRDPRGHLIVDSHQWPHGLRWLTDWLHRRHLLAGIYTDAGRSGCRGQGVGSLGHYQQDADGFAAWGFDAVKVDFCGAGQEGFDPKPLYTRFARALADNSSRRRLLLNVCNFWVPGQIDGTRPSYANSAYATYGWAAAIAQSWRTDTDIGFHRNIQWVNVLRNLDHDAAHPAAGGPGHWNDPDYLGPELGMTPAEAQAQLSMWAIVAAPLILGSDPRALAPSTIAMLKNREVLAIDQDRLGVQGTMIAQRGSAQVWAKPLAGGQAAVALLNRGAQPVSIATTASQVGLASARSYRVTDLWAHETVSSPGDIEAVVAPDSVVLYRVAPAT
jgi:alpha-galactosidase